MTTRRRSIQQLTTAVPFIVAAIWLMWMNAPPSVIPYLGFWFDFAVVPGVVFVVLGLFALAIKRGLAPKNLLAWAGVATLGLVLVVEALGLWIALTFASGL